MAANKTKIVLGGKAFELLRLRGNNPQAKQLLGTHETRGRGHIGEEEPLTMLEWFMYESHASSSYVDTFIKDEKAQVFFLVEKGKGAVGFFSILPGKETAELGSLYLMKEYRHKSFGAELVARSLRIARKSGFLKVRIPEMTDAMEISAMRAMKRMKKTWKTRKFKQVEPFGGPDLEIELHKRPNRRERRAARR